MSDVLAAIVNYAFDPDRKWRTCCFVLPACVAFGCWMERML